MMMTELVADLRTQAAWQALHEVRSGMVLGLGTGRTAIAFIRLLAGKMHSAELSDIRAVPTSDETAALASELDIPLTALDEHQQLDLVVDSADDVDPSLNLIKGLGRALLREKIVAIHARRFLVIVDESKLVQRLGERNPLPVEIVPFEVGAHVRWLNTLGCRAELWLEENGAPVVTDNSNYLARCWFPGGISDPYLLAAELAKRPGIVEHGIFLDMVDQVIVAGEDGIRKLERYR